MWTAKVQIKTKDGKAYEERVNMPKGNPRNPFTDGELQERFRSLAGRVFPEDRTREIVRVVWRLEKVSNIRELTELM